MAERVESPHTSVHDSQTIVTQIDSTTTLATEAHTDVDQHRLLNDDFVFYSHLYSAATVIFAMALLSKFLLNDFKFGFRSFLALVLLFVGEPVCELLLVNEPTGVIVFTMACFIVYQLLPQSQLPAGGKTILITGCDSGIGHALVKYLDAAGMTVFAGCLNASGPAAIELKQLCSDRLRILQMDVQDQSQIDKAYSIVEDAVGEKGIWGLINNAGVCYMADIELTSEHIMQRTLDVNFYGVVRCSRTFLPLLRLGGAGGRIVNMSSLAGRVGMQCLGSYAVSKAAVEMFSDVLRLEMKRYYISVSVLCLGGFRTGSMEESLLNRRQEEIWSSLDENMRSYYGRSYLSRIYDNFSAHVPSFPSDLEPICRGAREALLSRSPSSRYLVGRGTSVFLVVYNLLPTVLRDKLAQACSIAAVKDIEPQGWTDNRAAV